MLSSTLHVYTEVIFKATLYTLSYRASVKFELPCLSHVHVSSFAIGSVKRDVTCKLLQCYAFF